MNPGQQDLRLSEQFRTQEVKIQVSPCQGKCLRQRATDEGATCLFYTALHFYTFASRQTSSTRGPCYWEETGTYKV